MIAKKEKAFAPITVTLETKEEADAFYHMLNCNPTFSIQGYSQSPIHGFGAGGFSAFKRVQHEMFFAYWQAHKPEGVGFK